MLKKVILIQLLILVFTVAVNASCDAGWKCDGGYRVYYNKDCDLLVREFCKYGCKPDGCVFVKECVPGWECNGNFRNYINEKCIKAENQFCQYGCINGTCLIKPAIINKTENSNIPIIPVDSNISEKTTETANISEQATDPIIQDQKPADKRNIFRKIIDSIISFFRKN